MLLVVALKSLFILFAVVVLLAPITVWMERKQAALMQDRIAANRASVAGTPFLGLLHPLADLIKLLTKENVVPAGANRFLHWAAPTMVAVPVLAAFAVIPYGGIYHFGDTTLSLVAADIDWGVLYVLALGALSSHGAVVAGWTGNSSWSRLGSIRSSLQTISYSVAMGLSLVGVFMVFGSLKLSDMALAQDASFRVFGFLELFGWLPVLPGWIAWVQLPYWGIFLQPLGFLMFLTCALAANKRPPFDLPDAGSELAGGYLTEYSGMRFGLFYVSQFVQVVVIAGLCATMFLGGWSLPYLTQATVIEGIGSFLGEGLATVLCLLLQLVSFFSKVAAMIWLQILIRWSLPRVRYDQLMDLCWKWLLPLSFLNVFATAGALLLTRSLLEAA